MTAPADVLLDQARIQLARQEAKLDAMRTLTGTAVAAGGVIAGFVAPAVAAHHRWLLIFPLLAFAGCGLAGGYVLAPRRDMRFGERLGTYIQWISDHGDEPGADESFAVGMATNLEANRDANRDLVESVAWWSRIVIGLFVLEVLLWMIDLITL